MQVQTFKHEVFGEIRTTTLPDGQVGFVGKDVAEVLGYTKTSDAVRKHVDVEDKGVFKMETPGGMQSIVFVNESGLYSLILSSKLPQARSGRWDRFTDHVIAILIMANSPQLEIKLV